MARQHRVYVAGLDRWGGPIYGCRYCSLAAKDVALMAALGCPPPDGR